MATVRFLQISGMNLGAQGALSAADREMLAKILQTAQTAAVEVVLVAGGFLCREQILPPAVNEVSDALATLPPVFIAPGGNDYWSALSPYSSLERARRGLEPLPDNVRVFTDEWQTLFIPEKLSLAVTGRAVTRTEGAAAFPADIPAAGGTEISVLLYPYTPRPAPAALLAAHFSYTALAEDNANRPAPFVDGLGNRRAGAGAGKMLTGEISASGVRNLTAPA